MLALVADLDPFAAGADEVFQRRVQVERVAHLVEVGHLQVGALPDLAAVGRQLAEDQLEQGGLAGAVGTDQADLVAAQDGRGEIAHDRASSPKALLTLVSSATILPLGRPEATSSLTLPSASRRAARGAQRFSRGCGPAPRVRRASTPLRIQTSSCASSLSALALITASCASCSSFCAWYCAEVAGVGEQAAAVEFDDAGGHPVEESCGRG